MKTMVKKIIIASLSFLIINNIYGQNIKNYFIPSKLNEDIVFYKPHPETGEETPITRTYKFIKLDDNMYTLHSENFINSDKVSHSREILSFSSTKVLINATYITNILEINTERTFYPPKVHLMLPTDNNKQSWEYENTSNEIVKCISEFVNIELNGETKNAIKVTRQIYENDILIDWATNIEYYVKGIGLVKITNNAGRIDYILKDSYNSYKEKEEKSNLLTERRLIKRVNPEARDNISGTVVFKIFVCEEGHVVDIKLISSSCLSCNDIAKAAIQQWKYEPKDGVGIQEGTITINFQIK
jgi:TonB family protein